MHPRWGLRCPGDRLMICPVCHHVAPSIKRWPFHCICGTLIREDGTYRLPVKRERREERKEIGIGTILHDIIASAGYQISGDCPCNQWIALLNSHDEEWATKKRAEIVDAMADEGMKRGVTLFGVTPPRRLLKIQAGRWFSRAIRTYRRLRTSPTPRPLPPGR